MAGWGSGQVGTSRWGIGDIPSTSTGPTIVAIDPQENESGIGRSRSVSIRFKDDTNIDPGSIFVTLAGIQVVRGGVAVGGATYVRTTNSFNGYDITVTPATPFTAASRVDVQVAATNGLAQTTTKTYSFAVGVLPRLVGVRNVAQGVLLADFNVAMSIDETLLDTANWVVTAITEGASAITIKEVRADLLSPSRVTLLHDGGGSTYLLTVYNVTSKDGDGLEPGWNTAQFDIVFEAEQEPSLRLFNTVFGPVGIEQRTVKTRHVERHSARRALAVALDEQVRIRFKTLDGTAGRDGRPGKLRGQ